MYQQSALSKSNEQSTTYLEKKSGELTENLSIIQTQIKRATDQLEIVRNQYEQASSKANGRRAGNFAPDVISRATTELAVQTRLAWT